MRCAKINEINRKYPLRSQNADYSEDMTNNIISASAATPELGWHYAQLEFSKVHPHRLAEFSLIEICRDRAMRVSAGHWPDMALISHAEAWKWLRDSGMEDDGEIHHILENLEVDELISPP